MTRTLKDYRPQHDADCRKGRCHWCGRRDCPSTHDSGTWGHFDCDCGLDALLASPRPEPAAVEQRTDAAFKALVEHVTDDEMAEPAATVTPSPCGEMSGFGEREWYACIRPKGHTEAHRNKSGFAWSHGSAPVTPEPPRFARPGEDMLFHKDTCARWVNTEIGWSYSEATPCNCGLLPTSESRSPSAPLTASEARPTTEERERASASLDKLRAANNAMADFIGKSAPLTAEDQRIASWGAWSGLEHHPWCNYPGKPLGERHCNCPVGAELYRLRKQVGSAPVVEGEASASPGRSESAIKDTCDPAICRCHERSAALSSPPEAP